MKVDISSGVPENGENTDGYLMKYVYEKKIG
jgi:hypothetical protein